MVELGKYAGAVMSSYAITALLLAGLAILTWRQSVKARRDLEAAEARRMKNG
jgi:heme exporter protein D